MASFTSVRNGLKTRLATIATLKGTYATPPGTINVPAAVVEAGSPPIVFDETMGRGADLMNFEIILLVSRSVDEVAHAELDAYLAGSGSSSVKAAIDGDGTLGGVADWTRVTQVTFHGEIEYGGFKYLGARLDVEVNVDGT